MHGMYSYLKYSPSKDFVHIFVQNPLAHKRSRASHVRVTLVTLRDRTECALHKNQYFFLWWWSCLLGVSLSKYSGLALQALRAYARRVTLFRACAKTDRRTWGTQTTCVTNVRKHSSALVARGRHTADHRKYGFNKPRSVLVFSSVAPHICPRACQCGCVC